MIIYPSTESSTGFRKVSISDLITQCNDAVQKMSANNPHKILMFNCALALRQLVDKLEGSAEVSNQVAPAKEVM